MNRKSLCLAILAVSLLGVAACATSGTTATHAADPAQTTAAEIVSMTGEIAAVDAATRTVKIRGPLGGELEAEVAEDVKNFDQIRVGDILTISYYQSIALSATKKGESNPLFTGGSATTAAPGERPSGSVSEQKKSTVTVVSVDEKSRSVVLQGADGTLYPVEVQRPEFVAKLKNLKAGDQIDVVTTEALITGVTKAEAGEKPSVTYAASTLVVDNGEVLRRVGNVLFIRNNAGRIVKVPVDPDFKFMLNGKEATVADVAAGTRLSRTAFRITEAASFEAP